MSSSRDYVRMARIAEQADRMEDMKEYILHVITAHPEGDGPIRLNAEERSVLSTAYKRMLAPRRTAWRTLLSLIQKEKDSKLASCYTEFKKSLQDEMLSICSEVIDVVKKYLLVEDTSSPESIDDYLTYLKMQGDYYRYEAEFLEGDSRSEAAKHSQECYEKALREATTNKVSPVDSTLLGLYLNYSVFLYEITEQRELAMTLASKAFDDATQSTKATPESKEAALILQLLSDNLKLWESEKEYSCFLNKQSYSSSSKRKANRFATGFFAVAVLSGAVLFASGLFVGSGAA